MRVLYLGLALLSGLLVAGVAQASEAVKATVSAAAEGNHVICTRACFLRSLYVTAGAASGYALMFDATADPVDGAVTPSECIAVPANTTVSADFDTTSRPFSTGLVIVFSTTGCFTKTESATAFFNVRAQ